jgi:GntR family transcriptional regulator
LRVNRNTIAKAYAELESQGVIETIPGKGCFLKANNSPFTKHAKEELLEKAIDGALVTAHHLQVGREHFMELVRERVEWFERKIKGGKGE